MYCCISSSFAQRKERSYVDCWGKTKTRRAYIELAEFSSRIYTIFLASYYCCPTRVKWKMKVLRMLFFMSITWQRAFVSYFPSRPQQLLTERNLTIIWSYDVALKVRLFFSVVYIACIMFETICNALYLVLSALAWFPSLSGIFLIFYRF